MIVLLLFDLIQLMDLKKMEEFPYAIVLAWINLTCHISVCDCRALFLYSGPPAAQVPFNARGPGRTPFRQTRPRFDLSLALAFEQRRATASNPLSGRRRGRGRRIFSASSPIGRRAARRAADMPTAPARPRSGEDQLYACISPSHLCVSIS